ncbi:MAG: Gfo/Idh/MocA family oxidoreductase [Armatimonadota bacterium]|nr:Gfo/Idh/MocA family oxidoreductase [Armatimonadota bacterium]
MPRQRIAVIGAGPHARDQHYPALAVLDEVELCAACDLDRERLNAVRNRYAIPAVYTDYREMIQKESPDGVVVVTQPTQLTDVALGCLELGVHLLIEKPPGCTSAEARRILAAARARNCRVMVSLNRRFMPALRPLREMARQRGLVHFSATYNKAGSFADRWSLPCSLAVADAIHLVDLARFVGGEVVEFFAGSARRNADFVNSAAAVFRYASGAFGTLNTHHCVGARVQRVEIHARGMSAFLDVGEPATPSVELWLDGARAQIDVPVPEVPPGVHVDNYLETQHFVRYIAGEEPGEAELEDVIPSVQLAEALAAGYHGEMNAFG